MTDPVLEALREIVPVTRGQVNLGGRTLRWIESGTGTPAALMLAAECGARHVVADGSGHAVPLDRPALVAEAIRSCLQ
jgi:pimeloyl-ACP methyl ester carboxylesterase